MVTMKLAFEYVPQSLRLVQHFGPDAQKSAPVWVQKYLIGDIFGVCNIHRYQVPRYRQRVSVSHTAQRSRVGTNPARIGIATRLVLEALDQVSYCSSALGPICEVFGVFVKRSNVLVQVRHDLIVQVQPLRRIELECAH